MTTTLADSLSFLLPEVPSTLVAPQLRPHLIELSRRLAPIHYCGFEIRLNGSEVVDFQQGFHTRSQSRLLSDHLRRSQLSAGAWGQLDRLLDSMHDKDSLVGRTVADLWLEFDQPPVASLSVFVGFSRAVANESEQLAVARSVIGILMGDGRLPEFDAVLKRCFELCPSSGRIRHLGLMLGRPAPFVRLQLIGPEPDQLAAYVRELGWPGDPEHAGELARTLFGWEDGLAITLDVGGRIGPRLGLEALFKSQPADEPGWSAFLDELVARDLCTLAKRNALLSWPCVTTPADTGGDWPAELVRGSLRLPADHLSSFHRRLSHIKLVLEHGRVSEAKAYFGFIHEWLRPGEELSAEPRDDQPQPSRRQRQDPIQAAVQFLLGARFSHGLWRDFSGTVGASEEWFPMAGPSDEWVSAFVGTALAETGDPRARQAAAQAWRLLAARRMPVGGWGYSRLLPVDGDSTSWGLRLARAISMSDSPAARAAHAALGGFRLSDGGIASYRASHCPHPSAPSVNPPNHSYVGWCGVSHACVTAASAGLGDPSSLEFLRSGQQGDGGWVAYWWADDEYATALAAEAMATTGRLDDQKRVAAALRWTAARLGADGSVRGSAFATAWAVRTLRLDLASFEEQHRRALEWLLERQQADGSWRASASLISPRPDVTERDRSPISPMSSLDEERTFTTATALAAITPGGP